MSDPQIPIELLQPHINRWIDNHDSTIHAFANICGLSPGAMSRIMNGGPNRDRRHPNGVAYKKKTVEFGTADKIITYGLRNPFLWHTNPKLKALYEQVV